MLTKKDLEQITAIVDAVLDKKLKKELLPMKVDIKILREDITMVKKEIEPLEPLRKDVKSLKEDTSKIRKDVNAIIDYFDNEYVNLRNRVERIEEHLNIPSVV